LFSQPSIGAPSAKVTMGIIDYRTKTASTKQKTTTSCRPRSPITH
jgi:hypothetical protein